MTEMRLVSGLPQPVYIAGIRYRSMFNAALESGISSVWIWKMLKVSDGFPVLIKRRMVATESWVRGRVRLMENAE
jgi:hypothetical protein